VLDNKLVLTLKATFVAFYEDVILNELENVPLNGNIWVGFLTEILDARVVHFCEGVGVSEWSQALFTSWFESALFGKLEVFVVERTVIAIQSIA